MQLHVLGCNRYIPPGNGLRPVHRDKGKLPAVRLAYVWDAAERALAPHEHRLIVVRGPRLGNGGCRTPMRACLSLLHQSGSGVPEEERRGKDEGVQI